MCADYTARLPEEALIQIFHLLPPLDDWPRPVRGLYSSTLVCRRWNAAATPVLYSVISWGYCDSDKRLRRTTMLQETLELARCSGHNLSRHIKCYSLESYSDLTRRECRSSRMILECASQLRELNLNTGRVKNLDLLTISSQIHSATLQRLTLYVDRSTCRSAVVHINHLVHLRKLVLYNFVDIDDGVDWDTPLQIQHGNGLSFNLKRLQKLNLELELPCLEALVDVLANSTFPALQVVDITAEILEVSAPNWWDQGAKDLAHFFSHHPLHNINFYLWDKEQLLAVLPQTRAVVIQIPGHNIDPDFLRSIPRCTEELRMQGGLETKALDALLKSDVALTGISMTDWDDSDTWPAFLSKSLVGSTSRQNVADWRMRCAVLLGAKGMMLRDPAGKAVLEYGLAGLTD